MKCKTLLFVLFAVMLIPSYGVMALDEESDDYVTVSETVKYYMTVTTKKENPILMDKMIGNLYSSTDYEISEEEYNNGTVERLAAKGGNTVTVETSTKRMVTSISSNGSNYRYKNVLTWKLIPSVRSYDIIAIGFLSNVEPVGNPTFKQEYCYSSGSCGTSTSGTPQYFSTGAGFTFKLVTGQLSTLKATFTVDVKKKNPNSTITTQRAYGDYAHATSNVSWFNAVNYQVNSSGIVLPASVSSYYDYMAVAGASWSGSW